MTVMTTDAATRRTLALAEARDIAALHPGSDVNHLAAIVYQRITLEAAVAGALATEPAPLFSVLTEDEAYILEGKLARAADNTAARGHDAMACELFALMDDACEYAGDV